MASWNDLPVDVRNRILRAAYMVSPARGAAAYVVSPDWLVERLRSLLERGRMSISLDDIVAWVRRG